MNHLVMGEFSINEFKLRKSIIRATETITRLNKKHSKIELNGKKFKFGKPPKSIRRQIKYHEAELEMLEQQLKELKMSKLLGIE